ncbi:ethylene-responsive transcription factor-like protein At4g13040 isoform X2 [Dioscorea cayenensis subsp. rotundata]|nr:ethylene-responsive transcription factor-like protein At4g13040 isoform X2 [Dioscorea cayenensis subsp. rotundata]
MVSLRRRKLLGLCSGKKSFPVELPKHAEIGSVTETPKQYVRSFSVHPMPLVDSFDDKQMDIAQTHPGSSSVILSGSCKEEPDHCFPVEKHIKHRKRHRRKHYNDQEPCMMRGVYFKNMKWQAAIKVDKKQIHLGTVGSQEEAAKLYDRAAFMCGREPNFELSEEDKLELSQYNWEEFLSMTRNAITSKKQQRRFCSARGRKLEAGPGALMSQSMSLSDDGDVDSYFL